VASLLGSLHHLSDKGLRLDGPAVADAARPDIEFIVADGHGDQAPSGTLAMVPL